jgi:hypothetical protein
LPGLGYHAPVKLVGADSSVWERGDVQSDGMFYFKDVPDGEYLLAVESLLQGQGSDFYYPGTFDRRKATRIRIVNHNVRGSNQFTFDPGRLPYVPISVVLDKPTSPERFYWRILLVTPNNIIEEERWPPGTRSIVLYGLRGQSYGIRLYGDPNYKTSNEMCSSADFPVTATPGLKTIHVQVPPNCQ